MKDQQWAAGKHQWGISLYTLLAAVVVLGVLTSVLVTSFDGTHSKGQALWSLMQNVGQAANRFHLDTSCYSYDVGGLWSHDIASSRNSCGTAIPDRSWHGPYLETMQLQGAKEGAVMTQFGPKAILLMAASSGFPEIYVNDLPPKIAKGAYEACGGDGSPCVLRANNTGIRYFYSDKIP